MRCKIFDRFQCFLHTVLFMQICVERSCELDWIDFLSTFSRHAAIHSQRLFEVIPVFVILVLNIILYTRSYAALRAADLDWIVGPGYSLGRVHSGRAGISKNVTKGGSQLTF